MGFSEKGVPRTVLTNQWMWGILFSEKPFNIVSYSLLREHIKTHWCFYLPTIHHIAISKPVEPVRNLFFAVNCISGCNGQVNISSIVCPMCWQRGRNLHRRSRRLRVVVDLSWFLVSDHLDAEKSKNAKVKTTNYTYIYYHIYIYWIIYIYKYSHTHIYIYICIYYFPSGYLDGM
jgi:hypothetical protein